MSKMIAIILFYLALTLVLMGYFAFNNSVKLEQGVYITQPKSVNLIDLIDNKGNLFTEAQLKGHWSLLFFGFSSCELICPLTLKMLNQTYASLAKDKRPEIIFISVDPERDSVQVLNRYIRQVNPDFIALRGDMLTINALQKQLHVSVSKTPMSHGTEILLINPEAKVQAYFYYPITAKALTSDLNRLITN